MTRKIVSLVGVLGIPTVVLGQVWMPAPTIGSGPRTFAAAVNRNGVIYAVGGTPWANAPDNDGSVQHWSPGETTWNSDTPLEGMGPIVGGGTGIDALGRIIVFGGYLLDSEDPGDAKGYDPVDGPNISIAQRSTPDTAIGLFAWAADNQGRLYGFGGGPGAGGPNSGYADRFDANTNTWTTLASMPTPVADACAAGDGQGHVLVFGGINAAGTARTTNVARYDIASNTWSDTIIPDLPVALSGARAALGADGRVYVCGGTTGPLNAPVTVTSVYKLELATNTWVVASSMSAPRSHFGLVLANDDRLYAIGGENATGGTNTVESLFTPRCPGFAEQPQDQVAWSGSIANISGTLTGAAPFTITWLKDGATISDGPTATGSTVMGASTPSLTVINPGPSDAGDYAMIVSNACGTTTSQAAHLSLRTPPDINGQWCTTPLHPAWAQLSSYASGISDTRIGGEAVTPVTLPDGRVFNLARPVIWDLEDLNPVDITPPGSVGGGVRDAEGDLLVGWFWHTWSCYGGGQYWTCAWQSAGYWQGNPPVFHEVHLSGAEYDAVNATDGMRMVGTVTYEYTEGNYASRAYLWTPPSSPRSLHPTTGPTGSFANAIDANQQYGAIIVGTTHAARWTDTAASAVDLHPSGYARSWIEGAADQQVVGNAVVADVSHAGMWGNGPGSFFDLHPAGAASSNASATDGGVQVGTVNGHAAAWTGNAASYVSLGAVLPSPYSASSANAVHVSASGEVIVVGQAYNPDTQRYEAMLWRLNACCLADFNGSGGTPDDADVAAYFEAWNDGDPRADVNASGGTPDDADVAYFFERWNAGC